MKKFNVKWLFAALAGLFISAPAQANEYLTGSVGYFDVLNGDEDAAAFGLEYRFNTWDYHIRPIVGVMGTTDSSLYGYAGINMEVPILTNQLYLIPNFAVGAYSEGDGKDLGGAIEFRSGIEIAYQMENAHRVGVAFNHLSNAGIYDKNPGVETLIINYSVPVGSILGN